MAIKNTTIKKFDSTLNQWDSLFPKTKTTQVEGLLSESNKINSNLLPDFLFGGLKQKGVLNKETNTAFDTAASNTNNLFHKITGKTLLEGIYNLITNETGHNADGADKFVANSYSGSFLAISLLADEVITIKNKDIIEGNYSFMIKINGVESAGTTVGQKAQTGDWVVFDKVSYSDSAGLYVFDFYTVNNSYDLATSERYGMVKILSNEAGHGFDSSDPNELKNIPNAQQVADYISSKNYVNSTTLNLELAKKVDKVTGMGLSHNDFTNAYKQTIDNLRKNSSVGITDATEGDIIFEIVS